ncbi:MAG TPA: hypothetical protein VHZ99_00865 [Steroidobacteraceae bacterium]|nr:hypothetical protein [Steroidobacteraceae bacterium]
MKVFLAWQTDAPARIGRNFLRDAIREALEQLKIQASIVEAGRLSQHQLAAEETEFSRQELRSLLKEIDESAALVADVTPLGQVRPIEGGAAAQARKLIDSDVAFEAGYALHALGERKLIAVFNAHFGWHDDLPPDFRSLGDAIPFTLVPNASRPEIESERRKLVTRLVSVLRRSISSAASGASAIHSVGGSSTAEVQRGTYFRPGEVLARSGRPGPSEISYSYTQESCCFLRLIPLPPLATPLPLARLNKVIERAPLLSRQPEGALHSSNEHGAISFEPSWPPSRGAGNLASSTQLFINGELWSVSQGLISHERGDRPEWIRVPFLSALVTERMYYSHLRALTQFALNHLTLSAPWEVECGIAGSRGLHLWVAGQETLGPIVQPEVVVRRTMKSGSAAEMDDLLLEFFNVLYIAAGSERAAGLHGFPPEAPRQSAQS